MKAYMYFLYILICCTCTVTQLSLGVGCRRNSTPEKRGDCRLEFSGRLLVKSFQNVSVALNSMNRFFLQLCQKFCQYQAYQNVKI